MSNNKNNKKKNKVSFNPFWIYGLIILAILTFFTFNGNSSSTSKRINEFEFYDYLKKGYVEKAEWSKKDNAGDVKVFITEEARKSGEFEELPEQPQTDFLGLANPDFHFTIRNSENFSNEISKIENETGKAANIIPITPSPFQEIFWNIIIWVGIIMIFWYFFFRRIAGGGGGAGGQIFNIGKSRAKLFDENDKVKVTFKNVAGLEGAKEEVQEIVDFLKNPEKYTKLGGKIPKGALLIGPPGTGKTLLAKAVAGEAQVPFFSLSGSDFVEMFVGVGASRVRDLFKNAKDKAPAIIFIDEIDAIGRARGKNNFTGSNDERENTLNQLLTEMDGFGTDTNVIVMAATNRADILDKALMRAGRFDRRIHVDLPELNERREIFEVHVKSLKLGEDVDMKFLARQTPGFSGADIANICNEAALIAARNSKEAVEKQDFLDAIDRIIGGLEKKNKLIKPHEKERIAYHEAGHAAVSWLIEHAAPLVKVTIVPRGKSLGAAWYLPEERQITTTEQLNDEICSTMGGRAAEKVVYNNISTGALSDLERVTKQASAMVSLYGLNEEIGNISYYDSTGQEMGFTKPYSEETARKIDAEISKIIEKQYQRAIGILEDNREKLDALAAKLQEKEVIFKEDLEEIFGKRQWVSSHDLFNDEKGKKEEEKEESPLKSENQEENLVNESNNQS